MHVAGCWKRMHQHRWPCFFSSRVASLIPQKEWTEEKDASKLRGAFLNALPSRYHLMILPISVCHAQILPRETRRRGRHEGKTEFDFIVSSELITLLHAAESYLHAIVFEALIIQIVDHEIRESNLHTNGHSQTTPPHLKLLSQLAEENSKNPGKLPQSWKNLTQDAELDIVEERVISKGMVVWWGRSMDRCGLRVVVTRNPTHTTSDFFAEDGLKIRESVYKEIRLLEQFEAGLPRGLPSLPRRFLTEEWFQDGKIKQLNIYYGRFTEMKAFYYVKRRQREYLNTIKRVILRKSWFPWRPDTEIARSVTCVKINTLQIPNLTLFAIPCNYSSCIVHETTTESGFTRKRQWKC